MPVLTAWGERTIFTYMTHALIVDLFADYYFSLDTYWSAGPTGGWVWLLAPAGVAAILGVTTSTPVVALLRPILEPAWAGHILFPHWDARSKRTDMKA